MKPLSPPSRPRTIIDLRTEALVTRFPDPVLAIACESIASFARQAMAHWVATAGNSEASLLRYERQRDRAHRALDLLEAQLDCA